MCATLYNNCGFFNYIETSPANHDFLYTVALKMQETGPMVYSPYPRRLESLTIWRYHYKGSTFTSVIFRPWILVQSGVWTLMTTCTADLSPNNWATLVVEDKNSPGTVQMSYLIYLSGKLRVLQHLQVLFKCEWTIQKLQNRRTKLSSVDDHEWHYITSKITLWNLNWTLVKTNWLTAEITTDFKILAS